MKNKKPFVFVKKAKTSPIAIDPELCNGCNQCLEVCQVDIFIPNPEKGKPPLLLYPEECWYDGSCVEACPVPGAIKLIHPLMNRVHWKEKK